MEIVETTKYNLNTSYLKKAVTSFFKFQIKILQELQHRLYTRFLDVKIGKKKRCLEKGKKSQRTFKVKKRKEIQIQYLNLDNSERLKQARLSFGCSRFKCL